MANPSPIIRASSGLNIIYTHRLVSNSIPSQGVRSDPYKNTTVALSDLDFDNDFGLDLKNI